MIGLVVSVNGNPLYTIGIGEFGLLRAGVDWGRIKANNGHIHEHLWVGAHGLESGTAKSPYWQNIRLEVGDAVTIKVVETDTYDQPLPGMPDFPISN